MKTKFHIGQTVRIKPHKIGRCKEKGCYNNYEFSTLLIGKEFIIKKYYLDGCFGVTKGISKNDNVYIVSPCMLEKVEERIKRAGKTRPTTTTQTRNFIPKIIDNMLDEREARPQPKECDHIDKNGQGCWRWMGEGYKINIQINGSGAGGGGGSGGSLAQKFYCTRCLKIEYR